MSEKIPYASAQPKAELLGCFERARKLDADGLGNAELFERAERYLVENQSLIDFKSLSKSYMPPYQGELPSSFKVRINDPDLDSRVNNVIREKYNISRVLTPFKMRIVLSAYIKYLEKAERIVPLSNMESAVNDVNALRVKAISLILAVSAPELLKELIDRMEANVYGKSD